jgi:hypothetical protein
MGHRYGHVAQLSRRLRGRPSGPKGVLRIALRATALRVPLTPQTTAAPGSTNSGQAQALPPPCTWRADPPVAGTGRRLSSAWQCAQFVEHPGTGIVAGPQCSAKIRQAEQPSGERLAGQLVRGRYPPVALAGVRPRLQNMWIAWPRSAPQLREAVSS